MVEEASEEELQRRREEELAGLQEQLAQLTSQLEALELNMRKYSAGGRGTWGCMPGEACLSCDCHVTFRHAADGGAAGKP